MFSTDPERVAKITDIIGLFLHPPENAIELCVDEKSQIQALLDGDSGRLHDHHARPTTPPDRS